MSSSNGIMYDSLWSASLNAQHSSAIAETRGCTMHKRSGRVEADTDEGAARHGTLEAEVPHDCHVDSVSQTPTAVAGHDNCGGSTVERMCGAAEGFPNPAVDVGGGGPSVGGESVAAGGMPKPMDAGGGGGGPGGGGAHGAAGTLPNPTRDAGGGGGGGPGGGGVCGAVGTLPNPTRDAGGGGGGGPGGGGAHGAVGTLPNPTRDAGGGGGGGPGGTGARGAVGTLPNPTRDAGGGGGG
eukprot:365309-Chlamydomonas_euryale.AAC.1